MNDPFAKQLGLDSLPPAELRRAAIRFALQIIELRKLIRKADAACRVLRTASRSEPVARSIDRYDRARAAALERGDVHGLDERAPRRKKARGLRRVTDEDIRLIAPAFAWETIQLLRLVRLADRTLNLAGHSRSPRVRRAIAAYDRARRTAGLKGTRDGDRK